MIRSLVVTLALIVVSMGSLNAETRTLTDQFGRSITADVIELDGDTLKIRRDDGVIFDLPIANLSIEDQKAIRQWAAQQPKKVEAVFEPNPDYLPMGLSRVKLSSNTMYQYEGYKHVHEMWGYSIQLTNKHLRNLENLRIEYNLYANVYSDLGTQRPISASKKVGDIRPNDSINFKTQGAQVCKRKDMYAGNSGGEVKGIWIRVYSGDKLIHDVSSPESLKESETWIKAGSEESRQSNSSGSHYYY